MLPPMKIAAPKFHALKRKGTRGDIADTPKPTARPFTYG